MRPSPSSRGSWPSTRRTSRNSRRTSEEMAMSAPEARPHYYEGQYLGASDLESAVAYGMVRDARHSLAGHAWGIAVGLGLFERSLGGDGSVEVLVEPGFAWDGFGRPIVVPAPSRIQESLLADIPFDPNQDPRGRLFEVWL